MTLSPNEYQRETSGTKRNIEQTHAGPAVGRDKERTICWQKIQWFIFALHIRQWTKPFVTGPLFAVTFVFTILHYYCCALTTPLAGGIWRVLHWRAALASSSKEPTHDMMVFSKTIRVSLAASIVYSRIVSRDKNPTGPPHETNEMNEERARRLEEKLVTCSTNPRWKVRQLSCSRASLKHARE